MGVNSLKTTAAGVINNVRYNWSEPPKGRYMNYKEIASYAFGGIGASFIINMGSLLIVSTTNMIVGGAIGVAPTDMYILYLISTFSNIPLTAIRANMVDNTRGKAGKYRPYLISMGIPTALIALGYVWFPYDKLSYIFTGTMFGRATSYVVTCAVVLLFNFLLQFFYWFFSDAYTNLIHVLSPNTQERTDVLAVKSVVYSLAPSIMNIVLPIVAGVFADDNLYDIRVYRISYPLFAIVGMALTIIVYANTKEKIVQAKTHTIQIRFIDSFKEVAKNKYFWIIALAGWLGFLEGAYNNILQWSYTYGHSCTGGQFALIQTLTGNAALWGMLLAPFFIKRFGKKSVLLAVNTLNVVFILAMRINMDSIWWLFLCVYLNWMVGAFEQITTPAIQADIRDYQQYRTGERIDGMFATVSTIGNLVTLATSAVLPAVQQHYGVYEGNGYAKPFDILDVSTGDPNAYHNLLGALIFMAAFGAFLNMVPYWFYDFTEKKQKCVVRVLKVRALFEDYGNNALNNHQIVEALDLVNNARKMALEEPKQVSKAMYKAAPSNLRKQAKKDYRSALEFNEEIEIAKFVCDELDKFNTPVFMKQVEEYKTIYYAGLDYIKSIDIKEVKSELKAAKKLPKATEAEKEIRKFDIKLCKNKISAKKNYNRYYTRVRDFVQPEMEALTALFDKEDEIDVTIYELSQEKITAKQESDKQLASEREKMIKAAKISKKAVQKEQKALMDEFARFNRAAKPYNDAKKLIKQEENYKRLDEITALYDDALAAAEEEDRIKEEKAAAKRAAEQEELERRKAEKAMKKTANKK